MQTETQQSVQVRPSLAPPAGTRERRSEVINAPLNVFSPSQGPCCTPECTYKTRNEKCREESECAHQGMCNGATAQCPTSEPKANFTACHGETQVCLNGVSERASRCKRVTRTWGLTLCVFQVCSGSICEKYGLEVCTCASVDGKDETELCHVCCMEKSMSAGICTRSVCCFRFEC